VDIYETEQAYVLVADLPGVPPENVELRVRERRVEICGTRSVLSTYETARRVIVERTTGRFFRVFHLEHRVDRERAEVTEENGIWHALLPKIQEEEE
jgi:HSP20 family protein